MEGVPEPVVPSSASLQPMRAEPPAAAAAGSWEADVLPASSAEERTDITQAADTTGGGGTAAGAAGGGSGAGVAAETAGGGPPAPAALAGAIQPAAVSGAGASLRSNSEAVWHHRGGFPALKAAASPTAGAAAGAAATGACAPSEPAAWAASAARAGADVGVRRMGHGAVAWGHDRLTPTPHHQLQQQPRVSKEASAIPSMCVQVGEDVFQYTPPRLVPEQRPSVSVPGKAMISMFPDKLSDCSIWLRVLVPLQAAKLAGTLLARVGIIDATTKPSVVKKGATAAAVAARGSAAGEGADAAINGGDGAQLAWEVPVMEISSSPKTVSAAAAAPAETLTAVAPAETARAAATAPLVAATACEWLQGAATAVGTARCGAATAVAAPAVQAGLAVGAQEEQGSAVERGGDCHSTPIQDCSNPLISEFIMVPVQQTEVRYLPKAPGVRTQNLLSPMRQSLGAFDGWRIVFMAKVGSKRLADNRSNLALAQCHSDLLVHIFMSISLSVVWIFGNLNFGWIAHECTKSAHRCVQSCGKLSLDQPTNVL